MLDEREFHLNIESESDTEANFSESILRPFLDCDLLESIFNTNSKKYNEILSQLKNYLPYSSIFLQRVSKREVPNYYDIIHNPMDLGTMTKKIKKYTDPSEFKQDLDLIWQNCRFFNGPSIFTNYANKMKEKADILFKKKFRSNLRINSAISTDFKSLSDNKDEKRVNLSQPSISNSSPIAIPSSFRSTNIEKNERIQNSHNSTFTNGNYSRIPQISNSVSIPSGNLKFKIRLYNLPEIALSCSDIQKPAIHNLARPLNNSWEYANPFVKLSLPKETKLLSLEKRSYLTDHRQNVPASDIFMENLAVSIGEDYNTLNISNDVDKITTNTMDTPQISEILNEDLVPLDLSVSTINHHNDRCRRYQTASHNGKTLTASSSQGQNSINFSEIGDFNSVQNTKINESKATDNLVKYESQQKKLSEPCRCDQTLKDIFTHSLKTRFKIIKSSAINILKRYSCLHLLNNFLQSSNTTDNLPENILSVHIWMGGFTIGQNAMKFVSKHENRVCCDIFCLIKHICLNQRKLSPSDHQADHILGLRKLDFNSESNSFSTDDIDTFSQYRDIVSEHIDQISLKRLFSSNSPLNLILKNLIFTLFKLFDKDFTDIIEISQRPDDFPLQSSSNNFLNDLRFVIGLYPSLHFIGNPSNHREIAKSMPLNKRAIIWSEGYGGDFSSFVENAQSTINAHILQKIENFNQNSIKTKISASNRLLDTDSDVFEPKIKIKKNYQPRSSFGMRKYLQSNEKFPEIYHINNTFPHYEYPRYFIEYELDEVKFEYHNIRLLHREVFMNMKKIKKFDFELVYLSKTHVMSILQQITAIVLSKIGYNRIQRYSVYILSDVLYFYLFRQIRHVIEFKITDNDNIQSLKLEDICRAVEIPRIYDLSFTEFKSAEMQTEDSTHNESNSEPFTASEENLDI